MGYKGDLPAIHEGKIAGVFDKGAGVLYGIVVSASATKTVLTVYDGLDTSGRILLYVAVIADDTKPVFPSRPLPYHRGLYVTVDGNIGRFTLVYDHLEE